MSPPLTTVTLKVLLSWLEWSSRGCHWAPFFVWASIHLSIILPLLWSCTISDCLSLAQPNVENFTTVIRASIFCFRSWIQVLSSWSLAGSVMADLAFNDVILTSETFSFSASTVMSAWYLFLQLFKLSFKPPCELLYLLILALCDFVEVLL